MNFTRLSAPEASRIAEDCSAPETPLVVAWGGARKTYKAAPQALGVSEAHGVRNLIDAGRTAVQQLPGQFYADFSTARPGR